MNMSQGNSLTKDQVLAIVACMLAVARVDGIRPEEVAVIRDFYTGSMIGDLPPFIEVEKASPELAMLPALKKIPGQEEFAEQVVLATLLAGYADGHLSEAEYAQVCAIAGLFGLSQQRTAELRLQVKDSLVGSLAHLPDAQSVAEVAKSM